ncbi:Oidioi.mRNA.OKI2018_I69.PAR.g12464.t1.cds [Oikopleura dioica]|uniref:Oidioi.mRNA.OKI2018_I69.PAR.g12464.t1.cds n=1 Tax=Oikopleura dioica TaxID=34765 RepID=A0ABN7S5U8_OIKDI|nr:Oidioi.mRNA.OKI2018_I69.PAR.g12464.t1.cds [Oikopleura dioica]
MDADTRSAVEHELRRLRREHEEELARNNIHFNVKPPRAELRKCFIHNAVPFVGFGFLDNFIMLIAGDAIESYFGTYFHISVLAAAGLGNTLSDTIGIVTGDLEN